MRTHSVCECVCVCVCMCVCICVCVCAGVYGANVCVHAFMHIKVHLFLTCILLKSAGTL